MQAVQYLCAFQDRQLTLAEANSPYLPPEQRVAARRFARQVLALSSRQLALLNRLGCERRRKQEDARHRAAVAEAERQRGGIPRSDFSAGGIVPSLPDKETGTAAAVGTAEAGSPVPAAPPDPEGP